MKKNIIIGINLMCIVAIGAVIVAVTNFTISKIEEMKAELKANQAVLPLATKFKKFEQKKDFFIGLDAQGKLVGYVILCVAVGYGGEFGVRVGVDKDFKIVEINILPHNETPGIGDKIEEESFRSQFRGKGIENLEIAKEPPFEGKIQAITGATISSEAVVEAVKRGLEELKKITQEL